MFEGCKYGSTKQFYVNGFDISLWGFKKKVTWNTWNCFKIMMKLVWCPHVSIWMYIECFDRVFLVHWMCFQRWKFPQTNHELNLFACPNPILHPPCISFCCGLGDMCWFCISLWNWELGKFFTTIPFDKSSGTLKVS